MVAPAERLSSIGLDEVNVKNIQKNEALTASILEFLDKLGVTQCEKTIGAMLYSTVSKVPVEHREMVGKYVLDGKLNPKQCDAAIKHIVDLKGKPLDVATFESACGAGVVVSREQIGAAVGDALAKQKAEIEKQRYKFNQGRLMGDLRKTDALKWADGEVLKEELEKQITAMLGPKTEADLAAEKKPAKKEKAAPKEKHADPKKAPKEEKEVPIEVIAPKYVDGAVALDLEPQSLVELARIHKEDKSKLDRKQTRFYGWMRAGRVAGGGKIPFVDLYDGTLPGALICLTDAENYKGADFKFGKTNQDEDNYTTLSFDQLGQAQYLSPGCAVVVDGVLLLSPAGAAQDYELKIHCLRKIGGVEDAATYPIQKSTNLTALRHMPFMRWRSQMCQSLFRIRSKLAYAVHTYMDQKGVELTDPNILTMSDCEGAGEVFSVSPAMFSKDENGKDLPVGLTVSSQLPLEASILGFKHVYTCQKSFRAEKSDTNKHLAEFVHVEYEGAFITIDQLLDFTEGFVKFVINFAYDRCKADFEFLSSRFAPKDATYRTSHELLQEVLKRPFVRAKHREVVDIIRNLVKTKAKLPVDGKMKTVKVSELPGYEDDLGSEHEKLIVDYFGFMALPEETRNKWLETGVAEYETGAFVFVTHWPLKIKSFYMAQTDDGSGECLSFDLISPRVGELFGGSMREWRHEKLDAEIQRRGMDATPIQWFLDLRKSGSCPHGGWGMGFDRLCMLVTGVPSVRDIVPFPVYYGHCPY